MSARLRPGPTARNDHVSWLAPPERRTRLAIFWAPSTHRWTQAVRPAANGFLKPAADCMARVVGADPLSTPSVHCWPSNSRAREPNDPALTSSIVDDPIG